MFLVFTCYEPQIGKDFQNCLFQISYSEGLFFSDLKRKKNKNDKKEGPSFLKRNVKIQYTVQATSHILAKLSLLQIQQKYRV